MYNIRYVPIFPDNPAVIRSLEIVGTVKLVVFLVVMVQEPLAAISVVLNSIIKENVARVIVFRMHIVLDVTHPQDVI